MVRSLFVAAMVSVSVMGGIAGVAQAAEPVPTEASVRLKVDLSKPSDARKFYNRLEATAKDICRSDEIRYVEEDQTCAKESLARAVRDFNHPTLTAMHEEKTAQRTIYADKGILYGAN
jgi:UrcA family protein